jgi:putative acetyltransferase
MIVRPETPEVAAAIHALTAAAFSGKPFSDGTEQYVVDALRAANALAVSLLAEERGEIIGHVAFSLVTIDGQPGTWYGLGPVSVTPVRQRQGIGTALIETGLAQLRDLGADGCVLLGDPAYYSRFGFVSDGGLTYRGVDPRHIQWLSFTGVAPSGEVAFHPAFDVTGE